MEQTTELQDNEEVKLIDLNETDDDSFLCCIIGGGKGNPG